MLRCSALLGTVLLSVLAGHVPAHAQATPEDTVLAPPAVREFPPHALRGALVLGVAPQASLNGKDDRLAPGARIRGADNLLLLPGQIHGQKLLVHYTRDTYRLIKDVWVLRPAEAALPWPETAEQAVTWRYDPLSHRWLKPQ